VESVEKQLEEKLESYSIFVSSEDYFGWVMNKKRVELPGDAST
jgi:hypothetical protein